MNFFHGFVSNIANQNGFVMMVKDIDTTAHVQTCRGATFIEKAIGIETTHGKFGAFHRINC